MGHWINSESVEYTVGMLNNGEWHDFDRKFRTVKSICIKPFEERVERKSVGLFENAKWKWSSAQSENSDFMGSNDNLVIQMASSGYFHCADSAHCDRSLENENLELDPLLDN